MGTVRLGNFPSLNNKKLTDCIDKGILFYFLNHFPRNFFTNMYMAAFSANPLSYFFFLKNSFGFQFFG